MSGDHEIIFQSKKSNSGMIIKKEKVDIAIKIKEEKIDFDFEIIKTAKNLGNPNLVPLLNELQLKIKKEENSDDLELLTVRTTKWSNNPDPLPLLNEQQLKIKEENAKRKRCLDGLQKVTTLIESSDFSGTSKTKVKGRKSMEKKDVEVNLRKKTNDLQKLIPEFKTFLGKFRIILK